MKANNNENNKHFEIERIINLEGTSAECLLLAKKTNKLLAGCDNLNILIFNTNNLDYEGCLRGHRHIILCLFELNSGFVLSSSWDLTIKMWDIERKECIIILI